MDRTPTSRRVSLWRRLRRALYRAYYAAKYLPFAAERRARREDTRRGFVVIQIDALAHEDFQRALEQGYVPNLKRLIDRHGWELRRYPAGLPSATPAAQAAIFHGTKDRIPAFRFYEKELRRVVIGSQQASMQLIRDRLPEDGVLSGGSSYVNLFDGGANRAVFTLAAKRPEPLFRKLGGARILLLLALHPIRILRMLFVSVLEYLREERDRLLSQIRGESTFYWWYLPFLHIGSNVILRELQTLAVLLDIYTGVPAIYTTYNAYDEFAHHFGPSSRTALKSLRALDRRIGEILRMIRRLPGRPYDLYVLSDHGQTPSIPYRVRYGETLGDTIAAAARYGVEVVASTGEFGPPKETMEFLIRELEEVAATSVLPTRQLGLRFGRWLRRHYSIFPLVAETMRVVESHQLVITYSSSLAHLYWTEPTRPLSFDEIRADPDRRALYYFLVAHRGIGLVITRILDGAHVESARGRALIDAGGNATVLDGDDPLRHYAESEVERRALVHLAQLPNSGDIILFGAYDAEEDRCICFDDQVGAHGALGGRQFWPFILTPPGLIPRDYRIDDPLDLHPLFSRYSRKEPDQPPASR
ncbi:MAG TPA: alkaline phosphatase family protein [Longimicrobiales bacterium]|nr:alkaline phosphatase family protein [Longimicrobiales bacterium]